MERLTERTADGILVKQCFSQNQKQKPSWQKWKVQNEERRSYLLLKGSE